jgi:hypothetical protein
MTDILLTVQTSNVLLVIKVALLVTAQLAIALVALP